MADYRTMYDKEYLGSWDLNGKDVTVTISAVEAAKLRAAPGKKEERKPILSFDGAKKKMICNITNARAIAGMYGNDTKSWVGKRITLFPTTTNGPGGGTVDCIRIRPQRPEPAPAPATKEEAAE